MEALAAISLAGNILQFLQFCRGLVSDSLQIYESIDGTTEKFRSLEDMCQHVSKLSTSLIPPESVETLQSLPGSDQPMEAEIDLVRLAIRCQETSDELHNSLIDARLKPSSGKTASLKQSVKNWLGKSRMKSLQETVENCRSDLMACLTVITYKKQSSVLRHMAELEKAKLTLVHDHSAKLKEISDLLDKINIQARKISTRNDDDKEVLLNSLSAQIAVISASSDRQWMLEHRIVKSLHYESLSIRHESIPDAHIKTFNWILNKNATKAAGSNYPKVTLLNWLRTGDGVYWVSGKPGSGKSTLMKFIADHPRTQATLNEWAGSKECIIAAYYFWNAGTRLQKTIEGLLRSLLFDIFVSNPQLIPVAVPHRWENASTKRGRRNYSVQGDQILPVWTVREMSDVLRRLAVTTDDAFPRFCLFVDGLDEYHGEHRDVIRILQTLSSGKNFKLCVSSRPWNVFEDSLGMDVTRKLYLHELTRQDIHRYISSTLQEDNSWRLEAHTDSRYENLVNAITTRAEGVFLWVVLVVRSVLEGLSNSDSIQMLEKRMKQIPGDLRLFFRHILSSIEPVYHKQMALYFQVALDAHNPFTLMHYSFLDQCYDTENFALDSCIKPMDQHDIFHRHYVMRRRLNARCKGLLETHLNPSESRPYLGHTVDFLHRTVRDFLRSEEMTKFLSEILGDFPVNTLILMAHLAFIKALPPSGPTRMLMEEGMSYGSRAEKDSPQVAIALVDEMFDVVKLAVPDLNLRELARMSIQNGLCEYVSDGIDGGIAGFGDISRLLNLALEASTAANSDPVEMVAMVDLLFSRGAELDDEKWGYFLNLLSTAIQEGSELNVASKQQHILTWMLPKARDINSLYLARVSWGYLFSRIVLDDWDSITRNLADVRLGMIQSLLAHGADPNAPYPYDGCSVWRWFSKQIRETNRGAGGDPERNSMRCSMKQETFGKITQLLVEAGANVEEKESLTVDEVTAAFPSRLAKRVNEAIGQKSKIKGWKSHESTWVGSITSWFWGSKRGH